MMPALERLMDRYDAVSLRERVLIAVGVFALLLYGYTTAALGPAWSERQQLSAVSASAHASGQQLASVLRDAEQGGSEGARRAYRDRLRAQIAEYDREVRDMSRMLVPPAEMPRLLQRVLASGRLQLVSLRKLPVERVGGGAQPRSPRAIYRHAFELRVAGSYADLHDYLARLEGLSWQMYWGRIELDATAHPKLIATLTVHTLSLDPAWLAV